MSKIRFLEAAEIHALDGCVFIKLRETTDGMLLIEIGDYQDRVQIGKRDIHGDVHFKFLKDLS